MPLSRAARLRAYAALAVTTSAFGLASPNAPAAAASTSAGPVPTGSVIVMLKDQLSSLPDDSAHSAQRSAAAAGEQNTVAARAGITGSIKHLSLANAFIATIDASQAAELSTDPGVANVVADAKITTAPSGQASAGTSGGSSAPPSGGGSTGNARWATCPSDPAKPLLEPEGLSAIDAAKPDGSPSAQQLTDGSGVKVAVMAEGLDPNAPDFLRANGTSAIVDYQDFTGAPVNEQGFAYGEEIYGDASTIAAQGRVVHDLSQFANPAHPLPAGCDIQIRGVAPGASVVALKVLDGGAQGTYTITSSVVQAIDYAVTVDHVNVISESIGAAGYPDAGTANAVQAFNDQAIAAGVAVVSSTGDAGATGTIGSPAADPLVISAAASTTQRLAMQVGALGTTLSNGHWVNGNIGAFSSGGVTDSGTVPVLTAPGDSGWAACSPNTAIPGCTNDAGGPSSIEAFGGTSEASPFIAGAAALVISAYRQTHQGASPSPALIRQVLTSSADDLGAPGDEQGAGQVNALSAVQLAMRINSPQPFSGQNANNAVLLSDSQFSNTAAPGATVTDQLTVTNPGNSSVTLKPSARRLVAIAAPAVSTVTLDPKTDPQLTGPTGVVSTYQTVHFTVNPGTDHVAVAIAYPSDPIPGLNSSLDAIPQVAVALLDPNGDYVIGSRPQGGTGTGNYGNVELDNPAAGTWTAILSTAPVTASPFGIPYTRPGYSGDVHMSIRQDRWTAVGNVPSNVVVPGGASRTIAVTTQLPTTGGDSTDMLSLGSSEPVVPIVQRALIPITAGGGTFAGDVTGGNGRALQAAQTMTYAFDVPAGHRDLDVATAFTTTTNTPAAVVVLIAPNGQVASSEANQSIDNLASPTATVQNYVADPAAGRWRLVVVVAQPVPGDTIASPFTGTISFDKVSVDAGQVPNSAQTVLPGGKATTFQLGLTNTGSTALSAYVDPRTTTTTQSVQLGSTQQDLPATEFPFLLAPLFQVPPQTTQVSASVTSALPIQAQLTEPTAGLILSGPNAVGAPTPGNGQTSTATVDGAGGYVTPGPWGTLAAQIGPFGPGGAPSGTASLTMSATTLGFDGTVTSSTGDPYKPGGAASTPIAVDPGANGTVSVTITPDAAPGTVVHGYLDVVTATDAPVILKLILPNPAPTGQLVAVIPFEYTVG